MKNLDLKKEIKNSPDPKWLGPVREIIIQTDWTNILVSKNESVWILELNAILSTIIKRISQ